MLLALLNWKRCWKGGTRGDSRAGVLQTLWPYRTLDQHPCPFAAYCDRISQRREVFMPAPLLFCVGQLQPKACEAYAVTLRLCRMVYPVRSA
eukprot:4702396-Amphidinium_carterae.2